MSSDPYEALGVKRTSSKDEIKAAYRKLALQFHPDRDSSPAAATAFRRVQEAADRLLKADVPHSPAAAAAAEARRSWQGSRRPQQEPSFWQTAGRRRATPLLFSAACIVGGCALFIGAVQANQHLYNHNKLEAAEQRISHPTERQQQIKDLITARRAETADAGGPVTANYALAWLH